MVFVRYTLFFWNPPTLSSGEEIEAGREIVATGGATEWKKKAPYLPLNERLRAERAAASEQSPVQLALSGAVMLGFLAVVFFAGPVLWVPIGIACVTVLPLSLYTFITAKNRYHAWIDKVVGAYEDHVRSAKEPKPPIAPLGPKGTIGFPGGSILIRKEERSVITFYENQDASTTIYGNAHDTLEQFRRDALHPLAPSGIRDDWLTITRWLGGEADILAARTPAEELLAIHQHEKFARAFVLYMREGKAPSPALSEAFAKYRIWLTELYPNAHDLEVTLTPEMRDVFDRMHA